MSNSPSKPLLENFTVEDLRAAVIIIDHACEQGAFKGWETIDKVFTVRNRVNAFADHWTAISEIATRNAEASDVSNNSEGSPS